MKELQRINTSIDLIENAIYSIRGQRVILDFDLANLYGAPSKRLNEQVKRNIERFPDDFMFQLTKKEWETLRSQIATLEKGRGRYTKYLPYAFTEHGALMGANVLKSQQAVSMSIEVIRTFIHLRHFMKSQVEMMKEIGVIKDFMIKNAQNNTQEFRKVWAAIEKLRPEPQEERKIGFRLK